MIDPGMDYFEAITDGEGSAKMLQARYKIARGQNG